MNLSMVTILSIPYNLLLEKIFSSSCPFNLTKNNKLKLHQGYIGCVIFAELEKPFDTVEHDILLSKLEHYGIRSIKNESFKLIGKNRYDSNVTVMKLGVLQGLIPDPLLFLILISDLNKATEFCKSNNRFNRYLKCDMKNLAD